MTKAAVIAFSARIASGKSTVSAAVAEGLGWPRAGFGDYLRGLAAIRGLGGARETLQELGASLIRDSLEQFCLSVLNSAGWEPGEGIVLDGIRHVQTLNTLRNIVAPMPVLLIYLDVPEVLRGERLRERGISESVAELHERHSTERQVMDALPSIADFRIDASAPLISVQAEIVAWIHATLSE